MSKPAVPYVDRPLTERQKRFVEEYLVSTNGARAARAAGYAENRANRQASRFFCEPEYENVRAAINEGRKAQSERLKMTADEVLIEAAKIARFSLGDMLHVTEQGDPYIDLSKATPDQLAALSSAEIEDFTAGRGDDAREVRRVKVRSHDKLGALTLLAKHLRLLNEVVEHKVDEEFARLLTDAVRKDEKK